MCRTIESNEARTIASGTNSVPSAIGTPMPSGQPTSVCMRPTTHAIAAATTTPQPTHCSRARSIADASRHRETNAAIAIKPKTRDSAPRRRVLILVCSASATTNGAPITTTAPKNVRVVRCRRPLSAPAGRVVASTANANGHEADQPVGGERGRAGGRGEARATHRGSPCGGGAPPRSSRSSTRRRARAPSTRARHRGPAHPTPPRRARPARR